MRKFLKLETVRRYRCQRTGRERISGGKDLRATQAYPGQLGLAVSSLYYHCVSIGGSTIRDIYIYIYMFQEPSGYLCNIFECETLIHGVYTILDMPVLPLKQALSL